MNMTKTCCIALLFFGVCCSPKMAAAWWYANDVSRAMDSCSDDFPCYEEIDSWNSENGIVGQCKDLDRLGGQPEITPEILKKAQTWCNATFPDRTEYYRRKVVPTVKTGPAALLSFTNHPCKTIREAYEYAAIQCYALGQEGVLKEMGASAQKFIKMKAWTMVGARETRTVARGVKDLMAYLWNDLIPCMKSVLTHVLVEKKRLRDEFLLRSNNNDDALLLALKKEKKRREQAEAARNEQEWFEQNQRRRDEQRREANRSGENGAGAQREQAYLDNMDTSSFLRIQKLNKKAKYQGENRLQFRQSAPAN